VRILIDIGHPAHVNFFKPIVKIFLKENHKIYITYLKRGSLSNIVKSEFPDIFSKAVGKHTGTKFSIVIQANLLKFLKFIPIIIKYKIDLGLSVGSFTLGAALKLLNKPNIQFDDDPERRWNVILEKLTSSVLIFPPIIRPSKRIIIMNALKEWSYLSPNTYLPDISILNHYELNPKEYLFIREVSTQTLNYSHQKPNLIASIAHRLPQNFKILLSLEDKTRINDYPNEWILLEEPVKDIHSLIFFSKCLISSGDSMAREAAILGVPSIYCGSRKMKANDILIEKGMLFHINPDQKYLYSF